MESPSAQHAPKPSLVEPPGGPLMWIVVAVELCAFAILFVLIARLRSTQPAIFSAGQAALDARIGVLLTATLLTSGWLAAEAVHAHRGGQLLRCRRCYGGAVLLGLAFVVLKLWDYAQKLQAGYHLGIDDFWDAYFLATGFHFVHVLVGVGLLGYVGSRVGKTRFEDPETAVAGTALFWHMCDIAWFFLFPLFFARH